MNLKSRLDIVLAEVKVLYLDGNHSLPLVSIFRSLLFPHFFPFFVPSPFSHLFACPSCLFCPPLLSTFFFHSFVSNHLASHLGLKSLYLVVKHLSLLVSPFLFCLPFLSPIHLSVPRSPILLSL